MESLSGDTGTGALTALHAVGKQMNIYVTSKNMIHVILPFYLKMFNTPSF